MKADDARIAARRIIEHTGIARIVKVRSGEWQTHAQVIDESEYSVMILYREDTGETRIGWFKKSDNIRHGDDLQHGYRFEELAE